MKPTAKEIDLHDYDNAQADRPRSGTVGPDVGTKLKGE
jgi:hypothetical protein